MEQAAYTCDLHTHSSRSDGAETPVEVIKRAADRGVRILALTDHDIVPEDLYLDEQKEEKSLKKYASSLGVRLLLGTEISCDTEVDDVHLICLGCDWEDEWFQKMEQNVAASRTQGYKELVERLQEDGMKICWEEVLENHGSPVDEVHVLKKMIFERIAEKGYAKDWSEAKLLIKNTERYQIKRNKPEPVDVIKAVHRTGGIVILAHPFLICEKIKRKKYIDCLVEAGLDGIEGCYTYDKTSYEGTLTKKEIEEYIRSNYEGRVKLISGGSDYHGDWKKGIKNPREIGECGITEAAFYENKLLAGLVR